MVLMRVSGDSMEPEIRDGDVVLLDQSKTRIVPGKMFAVGFEESIYIKRIDNLPGKVILKVKIQHTLLSNWMFVEILPNNFAS